MILTVVSGCGNGSGGRLIGQNIIGAIENTSPSENGNDTSDLLVVVQAVSHLTVIPSATSVELSWRHPTQTGMAQATQFQGPRNRQV